jgi:hypothetical protein
VVKKGLNLTMKERYGKKMLSYCLTVTHIILGRWMFLYSKWQLKLTIFASQTAYIIYRVYFSVPLNQSRILFIKITIAQYDLFIFYNCAYFAQSE